MEFEENKDSKAPIRILLNQVNVLNEENEKHRHEILNLKSKQRDQEFGGLSIGVNTDFDLFKKDPELMNEDGELQMAFLSQRQTIQLLEAELKAERKNFTLNDNELREELRRLRKDNQRQQKLISRNLVYTSEAKTSDSLQHEVASLNHENVEFREKIELYEKEIKRLKKQVKLAASRLKSRGVDLNIGTPGNLTPSPGPIAAAVQRKDHVYMGMYAYKMEDESNLIRNLVIDLKPKLTEGVLPGLPSYIIFMCLRHADYTNNDTKVKSLLRHGDDFESVVCYLVNTCRLLHLLKQYSGEKNFTTQNTKKQNEHCLRNFDISEYRQVVNDLAVHTYQGLVRCVEKKLQTMIVPGMVEHEGITGAISSMHDGMSNDQEGVERITIYTITKQLSTYLSVMHNHGLDPQIVKQLYKQIFYLMTATTLNNLVLRKEMCHWSKGMQIRYNVSELEEWLRGSKLVDSGASETLEPLVQVSQLLQVSKKVDQDVDSICELCTKLSTQQIIKILNHYTPVNEFETRVEASFVRKVHDKLRKSRGDTETQKLLMDTKHAFPVTFPYNPSTVELDTITIPESWNLNFLERM
uniref:Unconventional myosin-Va-like n=1 Tax=Saccoglossus kowalevskii TaxID=10224 RepID=A0ABM0GVK7_SACKO|nr:PREDICTED: unconventional myosin-Va-like [Saccoglossus kowalevskii]